MPQAFLAPGAMAGGAAGSVRADGDGDVGSLTFRDVALRADGRNGCSVLQGDLSPPSPGG